MQKTLLAALMACSALGWAADEDTTPSVNCTFQAAPERFLMQQFRAQQDVFSRVTLFASKAKAAAGARTVAPDAIPRRNFVDDEIFAKLASMRVSSAPLSGDAEFFRRLMLDLTGRIPTPQAIRDFVADTNPDKRNKLIDKLLYSDEFVEKWTVWMGDWLGVVAAPPTSTTNRQVTGRNAFQRFVWAGVLGWQSLKDMAYECLSKGGNNYDAANGAVNFLMGATSTGPAEDTYDLMLVNTARTFLGLGQYDCLLCHNGRGHLDALSLWGKRVSRTDAENMAAFFSRTRVTAPAFPAGDFYVNSRRLDVVTTGNYNINTNFGNRPNRLPIGNTRALDPAYRETGAQTTSPSNWRTDFADNMVKDPMFARNIANRLWKQMFNLALADPVDSLDPARLDPANPPEAPWTFQASHPELLERLARELVARDYSLREFLRLLLESSAYQLSSTYPDEWKLDYVTLFARHYPRRLDGEEVHDAITKSTGAMPRYTVTNWNDPVQWAMQLPDVNEPASNAGARNFMNTFLRGNRDNIPRSQAASILQQLALMNDAFVRDRIHMTQSPVLQAVSRLSGNTAMLEEMFLTFLGRMPAQYERSKGLELLDKATTAALKNTALEDLAWALVNRLEYIFSY